MMMGSLAIERTRTAPVHQQRRRDPNSRRSASEPSSLSPKRTTMRRLHTIDTTTAAPTVSDNNSNTNGTPTSFISMFAPSLFGSMSASEYGISSRRSQSENPAAVAAVPEDTYERARTAPVRYSSISSNNNTRRETSSPRPLRRAHTIDTTVAQTIDTTVDFISDNTTSFISMIAPTLFGDTTTADKQKSKQPEEDKVEKGFRELTYSDNDLISILDEDAAFQTLKSSLRQRGCVTNAYLQLNLHFYVKHVKDVRAKQQQQELEKQLQKQQKKKSSSSRRNKQRVPRKQRHETTTTPL